MMEDKDLWNLAADHWNQRQGFGGSSNRSFVNEIILSLIDTTADEIILDAGCGTGPLTRLLQQKRNQARLFGLDFSFNELVHARSYSNGNRPVFSTGDVCGLPFSSNSFSTVILNFVLSDLPDLHAALNSVYRVLKPDGKLIISLVHPVSMLAIIEKERRKAYQGEMPVSKAISVNNYFSNDRHLYYWSESISTRVYHRTIQDYFSAMVGAGFTVSHLLELPTDKADVTNSDEQVFPRYLILAGHKNGAIKEK